MIELLKTADPVRLHYLRQALESADIPVFVFGAPTAWPAFPARLMVPEAEADLARRVIREAEA